jgi:hypothetical protein
VEEGYVVEGPGEVVGFEGVNVHANFNWGDEGTDRAVSENCNDISEMNKGVLRGPGTYICKEDYRSASLILQGVRQGRSLMAEPMGLATGLAVVFCSSGKLYACWEVQYGALLEHLRVR